MNALLATFVIEARELLQESGEDLLALERAPGDADAINRLFRSVHTLKGSSGLFDAQPLTKLLHALEDMFQAVRERGLALTPEMVDLSLQALDRTGQWIDQLDRDEVLADDADAVSKTMVVELRTRFGRRAGEVLGPPPVAAAMSSDEVANYIVDHDLQHLVAPERIDAILAKAIENAERRGHKRPVPTLTIKRG